MGIYVNPESSKHGEVEISLGESQTCLSQDLPGKILGYVPHKLRQLSALWIEPELRQLLLLEVLSIE